VKLAAGRARGLAPVGDRGAAGVLKIWLVPGTIISEPAVSLERVRQVKDPVLGELIGVLAYHPRGDTATRYQRTCRQPNLPFFWLSQA